jgi:hypothetical protein
MFIITFVIYINMKHFPSILLVSKNNKYTIIIVFYNNGNNVAFSWTKLVRLISNPTRRQ